MHTGPSHMWTELGCALPSPSGCLWFPALLLGQLPCAGAGLMLTLGLGLIPVGWALLQLVGGSGEGTWLSGPGCTQWVQGNETPENGSWFHPGFSRGLLVVAGRTCAGDELYNLCSIFCSCSVQKISYVFVCVFFFSIKCSLFSRDQGWVLLYQHHLHRK